jgi:protein kinase A
MNTNVETNAGALEGEHAGRVVSTCLDEENLPMSPLRSPGQQFPALLYGCGYNLPSVNLKEEDDLTETTVDVTERTADELSEASEWKKQPLLSPVEEEEVFDVKDLKPRKILGEGFFGQVWLMSRKAEAEEELYAVKIMSKYDAISEHQVENVRREKNILSRLQGHPFIVNLVGTCQDDNLLYLVQDFVQGGELFTLLHGGTEDEHKALPESQARFYAACLTDALWYMHRQHIVYRDVKPENLLIDSTGYPVLIDFGHAKHLTEDEGEKANTLCGTPRYVPPEMIEGLGHSYSADHWSLGVLIYEMLSGGVNPFECEGMNELDLYRCIVEEHSQPLAAGTVSAEAVDIVSKLLVKHPSYRLGTPVTAGGNEILEHAWMRELDLPALRRKALPAPWVPEIRDALDTSHFDDWNHLDPIVQQKYPKLTAAEAALFKDF